MTGRHRRKDRSGARTDKPSSLFHKNTFVNKVLHVNSVECHVIAPHGDAASLIDQTGRHSIPFGRRKPTRGADERLQKLKCASKARGAVAAKESERGCDGILDELQF